MTSVYRTQVLLITEILIHYDDHDNSATVDLQPYNSILSTFEMLQTDVWQADWSGRLCNTK